jgi:DNA polymerase I
MMPAFDEIWFVDFEFRGEAGDPPEPVCMVANEWFTGREIRLWEDELRRRSSPPYRCDRRVLFVSYIATAELVCHLALGWELPAVVLDLFVEFRRETNGKHLPAGRGLLGALTYYEISGIDPSEKKEMITDRCISSLSFSRRPGPLPGLALKPKIKFCVQRSVT